MNFYQQFGAWSTRFWPLLANHLWQATLFFLMVVVSTALLRRAPARIRYTLWLISAAKLALPSGFTVLLVEPAGVNLAFYKSVIHSEVGTGSPAIFPKVIQHAVQLPHSVAVSSQENTGLYLAGTAVWFLGLAASIGRWRKRKRRLSMIIGSAKNLGVGRETQILKQVCSRLSLKRDVQLMLSTQVTEPGVWGIRKPVILLPENLADHLSDAELETVIIHELTHVKRWDNPISHFQILLCSLFWFYPVVWIIDRKLLVEREQACDEEVLRVGGSSDSYASSLWKVFRFCLGDNMAGVSMATGSNLRRRIERIMSGSIPSKVTHWHRTLLAVSAAGMILFSLASGLYSQGGKLSGSVYDPSGAAVPGASVTVFNLDTDSKGTVFANEAGEYEFLSLPTGNYLVEANHLGFKSVGRKRITIKANAQAQLDLNLEVGEVAQYVEVTAKSQRARPLSSSQAGPPHRVHVGGNVQQAKLIFQKKHIYPEHALQEGIEGSVLLEAVISKDGTVGGVRVFNRLADPELIKAAIEAVKEWRYEPTLLNGEPVEVLTTITVNFRLSEMP